VNEHYSQAVGFHLLRRENHYSHLPSTPWRKSTGSLNQEHTSNPNMPHVTLSYLSIVCQGPARRELFLSWRPTNPLRYPQTATHRPAGRPLSPWLDWQAHPLLRDVGATNLYQRCRCGLRPPQHASPIPERSTAQAVSPAVARLRQSTATPRVDFPDPELAIVFHLAPSRGGTVLYPDRQ
jgi:hypothetical protein